MPQRGSGKKQTASARKQSSSVPISRDKKSGTVTVSLRVPVQMLKEIDEAVKVRPYKMPRHMWLLEAIHEKLTRLREAK